MDIGCRSEGLAYREVNVGWPSDKEIVHVIGVLFIGWNKTERSASSQWNVKVIRAPAASARVGKSVTCTPSPVSWPDRS
jgi:hypothetical protein